MQNFVEPRKIGLLRRPLFATAKACLVTALSLGAAEASAQVVSWRVSTYGVEPSAIDVAPGALAFDADNNLYAFEYLTDIGALGVHVRVTRLSADGTMAWQQDVPSVLHAFDSGAYPENIPTAAMATRGDELVLATTQDSQPSSAVVTRYAVDGRAIWQSGEQNAAGIGYDAVLTDAAGDVVASGANGLGAPVSVGAQPSAGHAAKFSGVDGSRLWAVDIDPAACGGGNFLIAPFVRADSNGDILLVAEPLYPQGTTLDFCAVKLDGHTGAVLWSHAHSIVAGSQLIWGGVRDVALDAAGDIAVGSAYDAVVSGGNQYLEATVAKLSAADGSLLWQQTAQDWLTNLQSIAMDAQGNVYASAPESLTRAFAAGDGHALWAADASTGGAIQALMDGRVLVASNRVDADPNPRIEISALDAASGASLWNTVYPVGVLANFSSLNVLAVDGAGHFAAIQRDPETCCGNVITMLHGDLGSGSIDWHFSDFGYAPSYADLPSDTQDLHFHISAPTPDDGVVAVGTSYLYSELSNAHTRLRLMLTKRAAHDGRLLWQSVLEFDQSDCEPTALAIDAAGDVLAAGSCAGEPVVVKYRGSDGALLWRVQPKDNCQYASVDSLALDGSGDVIASGVCDYPNAVDQLTTRLATLDGHALWTQHTPGDGPMQAATGSGIVYTVASQQIVSGQAPLRVRAGAMDAGSGAPLWSHTFDPPGGGSYAAGNLAALPGGDALMSASGLLVRLASDSGLARWTSYSHGPIDQLVLDANGNPVFIADNAVSKVDAATGADAWSYSDPATVGFYGGFHDLTLAPDGTVLAVGNVYPAGSSDPTTLLHVAALDPLHGTPRWTFSDAASRGTLALGVVAARDGGVLVSADYALQDASPWSLVRVAGPDADGIFAAGFEP